MATLDKKKTPKHIISVTYAVLVMLVYVEWVALWLSNNYCKWSASWDSVPCWTKMILLSAMFFIVGIIVLMIHGYKEGFYQKPSSELISGFLSNSVKGALVRFIILFLFLANVTWAIDCMYSIFMDSHISSILHALIPVSSLIILIYAYPYIGKDEPALEEKTVIVSSFSLGRRPTQEDPQKTEICLTWENIDLFLKPYVDSIYLAKKKSQPTEPESVKLTKIKKHIIIPSPSMENIDIDDTILNNNYKRPDYITQKINDICQCVLDLQQSNNSRNSYEKLASRLEMLIEVVSGMSVTVEVRKECDYDDFDTLNASFQVILKDLDPDKTLLYINPGTVIASSCLAILSVVGGRTLIYLEQKNRTQLLSIYVSPDKMKDWFRDLLNDANNS